MPHASFKIIPGVDTNKTPALNEAAVSQSNLVRFFPDRTGAGLAQKVGGWTQYVSGSNSNVVRALNGWLDLANDQWLAIGSEGTGGLYAQNVTLGTSKNITPNEIIDDITLSGSQGISTTAGSDFVTVYSSIVPTVFDYVYFPTQISVGNLLLFGAYEVSNPLSSPISYKINVGATQQISTISSVTTGSDRTVTVNFSSQHNFYAGQSVFVFGSSLPTSGVTFNGTFTVTTTTAYSINYIQTGYTTVENAYGGTVNANIQYGGLTPQFTTATNTAKVTVTLINHGLSPGSAFNIPIATTVGGVTLSGLYTVTEVLSYNTFTIYADSAATSSATAGENADKIRQNFFVALQSDFSGGNNSVYGGTGTGKYGDGVYSTGQVPLGDIGDPIQANDWALDNWGEILISNPINGPIYYWQPSGGSVTNSSYIPNSPFINRGVFVAMPQRQLIAYGSSFSNYQDPLLIRWSDVEDFSTWQGTANNQAGSFRLPTGNKIVGGMQSAQQAFIWTDLDAWSMQYIGPPYIYSFNKIGSNAGLIGRKAMGQLAGATYWMSQKQFFRLAGQGPELIPCPVWDQVFQNLYVSPTTGTLDPNGNPWFDRIRCAPNTQFNEIVWYYPAAVVPVLDANGIPTGETVAGTGENNAYVRFNISLGQWDYGYQNPNSTDVLVARTAWIDQSILGPPIGAASTNSVNSTSLQNFIYQHETSNMANGKPIESFMKTGYFALAEGDQQIFIDQVWPDMKWGTTNGSQDAIVNLTFYVLNYVGDTPKQYTYEMTQSTEYLSVRMRGRFVAISVSGTNAEANADTFWRLGNIRYRFQPDGKY